MSVQCPTVRQSLADSGCFVKHHAKGVILAHALLVYKVLVAPTCLTALGVFIAEKMPAACTVVYGLTTAQADRPETFFNLANAFCNVIALGYLFFYGICVAL